MQLCDLSGTPRELAGDSDRILPGDGDFPLGPIVDRLARIGYDGYVSLELLNPQLWQISADRVADVGYRALSASSARGSRDRSDERPTRTAERRRRTLSVSSVATLQPATAMFREEQYFDWRVYALIASLEVLTGLGLLHQNAWSIELLMGLVVGIGLVMFLVVFLLHMTTEVTPTDVRVWFGWVPVYRRVVPLGDVRRVELVTFRPIADYGFWGIRSGRDGERALIARGNRGVRLELADGSLLVIGSQRPEELAHDPGESPCGPAPDAQPTIAPTTKVHLNPESRSSRATSDRGSQMRGSTMQSNETHGKENPEVCYLCRSCLLASWLVRL